MRLFPKIKPTHGQTRLYVVCGAGFVLLLLILTALFVAFGVHASLRNSEAQSVQSPPSPTATPTSSPQVVIDTSPQNIEPEDIKEMNFSDVLNLAFGSVDADCDGLKNSEDNCPVTFNPDQEDVNKNGIGDACDAAFHNERKVDLRCDHDGDGVLDKDDNCKLVCNPDQKDTNKNGIGDACESPSGWYTGQILPCKKPVTDACSSNAKVKKKKTN